MKQLPQNGELTQELRQSLRKKRCYLGLSYETIATFMNIQWCTWRKWELGPTKRINPKYIEKINNFLLGIYDHILIAQPKNPRSFRNKLKHDNSNRVLSLMKVTYDLVKDSSSLSKLYCARLNQVFNNTIRHIMK